MDLIKRLFGRGIKDDGKSSRNECQASMSEGHFHQDGTHGEELVIPVIQFLSRAHSDTEI
jgi:hypothetical protein